MKILNRRAKFDYQLEKEHFEAGLSLFGAEAKAIRGGHADLTRSAIRILNGEMWLINANIPINNLPNYQAQRSRKLLLHRVEIQNLEVTSKQKKLAIVPISLYTKRHLVKLGFALGHSKHQYEKKASIKKKDLERELELEYKSKRA